MKIGQQVTNPGALRTKIVLTSPTVTQSATGFQEVAWTTVATIWARWTNAHGSEVVQSDTVQQRSVARALIRYRADVQPTWRVWLGSQPYEIIAMDDIAARHEYIELTLQAVRDGG